MGLDWTQLQIPAGAKRDGQEFAIACPFVPGSKDSLKVNLEKQVFLCRRCSPDGDGGGMDAKTFQRHAEFLGIWVHGKPLDTWTWCTADGRTRVQYRWRNGTKPWARPTAESPEPADLLYLHRVLVVNGGDRVYLAEGATSADALAAAGLVAVGRPSARPSRASLARFPREGVYVVWPDHDLTGYRQAVTFGTVLEDLGYTVKAVDPLLLKPDAPAKWDPRDWWMGRSRDAGAAAAEVEAAIVPLATLADRARPKGGATSPSAEAGGGFPAPVQSLLDLLPAVALGGVAGVLARIQEAALEAGFDGADVGLLRAAAVEVLRRRKVSDARGIVRGVIVGRPAGAGGAAPGSGRALSWPETKAAEDAQTTSVVLADVERNLRRFVAWPDGGAVAVACWILWVWVSDHSSILPILALSSPLAQCGKTTAVDLLGCFVRRSVTAANVSSAAMFRLIEAERPTLLLDEVDRWLREDQGGERIGILNAGHRRGGRVIRCVGDGHDVRTFAVDTPKVLAGIGELPNTLGDRSVIVTLERAAPGDRLQRFRLDRHPDPVLPGRLLRWAEDHGEAFGNLDPEMGGLANRPADNWRPLFAVADLAGGTWPARIRAAAEVLIDRADQRAPSERYPEMLLADVREIFKLAAEPKTMTGVQLDEALQAMAERPWATCSRGKPLTAQLRGRWLARFGIQSRTLEPEHVKGYHRSDLDPVWARYLELPPIRTVGTVESEQNQQVAEIVEPWGGTELPRFDDVKNVNESGAPHGSHGSTTQPTGGGPARGDILATAPELIARGEAEPTIRTVGTVESEQNQQVAGIVEPWGGAEPPRFDDVKNVNESGTPHGSHGSTTPKGGDLARGDVPATAPDHGLTARGEVELPPAVAEDWRQPNLGRSMDPWPSGVPGDVRVQSPAPRVELDEGRPKRDTNGSRNDG